jgi:ribonuclease BN (tRNA processing enzyme)
MAALSGPTPGRSTGDAAGPTLTVLGCDGSYPGPGGAASGYLVRHAGATVWLDAGPGTFANLQLVADPGSIDAVVLSHEHPDHWGDVESLAVWAMHNRADRPVPVYAPPGLRRRSYFADAPGVSWSDVEPDQHLQLGGLECRFAVTDHGPPTMAIRLDAAGERRRSLAFSADTGPAWSVSSLGDGIGTFLCEATFTAEHEGASQHLSGRQAGSMAAAAGVGRLVLTHRWPTVSAEVLADECAEAFGAAVGQAAIGQVLEW